MDYLLIIPFFITLEIKLSKFHKIPPVLFVIFNRPEKVKLVFDEIRKVKPEVLYVACDGPREGVHDDQEKILASRNYVLENIDWECSIKTRFRNKNIGLIGGYCGAISWFFENEEEGIILEDDTLPSSSFFYYCSELLDKYRDDSRVMNICGFNIDSESCYDSSYFFSFFPHAWGWATWKRSWNCFLFDLDGFLNIDRDEFSPYHSFNYFYDSFKKVYEGNMNSCLLRWYFTLAINNGLSIIPSKSLIRNIGFDASGTNFKNSNSKYARIDRSDMEFPLKHPISFNSNYKFDSIRISEKKHEKMKKFNLNDFICKKIKKIKKLI